jgi:hypothetical protein
MGTIDHLRALRDDGAASDLLLFLWGRARPGPLERSGDPAVLTRVRELAAAATQ